MFFFFKQKTEDEMSIRDWSSDVCSSDLPVAVVEQRPQGAVGITVVIFLDILIRQVDRARGDAAIGHEMEIMRSEERRVGKECVSKCRSRWSPTHYNKKNVYSIHVTTDQQLFH